jgi:hypothetical protein
MSQAPRTIYRLIYDGIELVLSRKNGPLICATTDARWALPGMTIATTNQLVSRANSRGVRVQLLTIDGINRKLQLLTEEENENDR